MLVNGDMELDSDWVDIPGNAPTANVRSTAHVNTGTYSRQVVGNAAGQGIQSNAWNMVVGHVYVIRAWVYVITGTAKMTLTGQTEFDRASTVLNAWQQLESYYVPTANATGKKLQFICKGGAATFWVDTVSIVPWSLEPEPKEYAQREEHAGKIELSAIRAGSSEQTLQAILARAQVDASLTLSTEGSTPHYDEYYLLLGPGNNERQYRYVTGRGDAPLETRRSLIYTGLCLDLPTSYLAIHLYRAKELDADWARLLAIRIAKKGKFTKK